MFCPAGIYEHVEKLAKISYRPSQQETWFQRGVCNITSGYVIITLYSIKFLDNMLHCYTVYGFLIASTFSTSKYFLTWRTSNVMFPMYKFSSYIALTVLYNMFYFIWTKDWIMLYISLLRSSCNVCWRLIWSKHTQKKIELASPACQHERFAASWVKRCSSNAPVGVTQAHSCKQAASLSHGGSGG